MEETEDSSKGGWVGWEVMPQDKIKQGYSWLMCLSLASNWAKLILFSFSVKLLLTISHFIFLVELADIAT